MMLNLKVILSTLLVLILVGCSADDPNQRAKIGAAVGAVAGAVIGHQIHDKNGRFVGAAAGAMAGAAAGGYMDKQEKEFEEALEEEQRKNQLEIERINNTLKVDINNEVSFDVDSAKLKPAFEPTMNKVAELLNKYNKTVVHVVGHTDSTGSEAYNLELSNRRAKSVQQFFTASGIENTRILTLGKGESEPRASNSTASGRQLNRRVELFIKPIIEGEEEEAYVSP